jgi:cytochrome c oxidase assembly factor 6
MSWFSSPSATTPTGPAAKPTSDGGYEAPNRSARAQCWESRDIFYECLDEHDILDAAKDDAEVRKKCPKELKYFEKDCASTWVCRLPYSLFRPPSEASIRPEANEPVVGF